MIFGALRVEEDEQAERHRYASILCPACGAPTTARSDGTVLCRACVAASGDDWRLPLQRHIERYPKILSFCRCPLCERVLTSEASKQERWEGLELESEQLLAFLLRRVKTALLGKRAVSAIEGLSRALGDGTLTLDDARFVWTEPHSRRVKLEVVVGHSGEGGASKHKCELEFYEERRRCKSCLGESSTRGRKMGSGGGDFNSKIQVRVKGTGGKRTMRSLEDALKELGGAATAARRHAAGFDVEFASRQHAAKFLSELRRSGRAPLRVEQPTKKLVTHDEHTNAADWQRTTLVWVPPIDKHDVVVTGSSAFALVVGVRNTLRVVDLVTRNERDVTAEQYFKDPFEAVMSTTDLADFEVLDDAFVSRDSAPPRRYVAPCLPDGPKPGRIYTGYDLESIAHRVHLVHGLPPVVLLLPAAARVDDAADDATEAPAPVVLSRKDRRKQRKQAAAAAAAAVAEHDDGEPEGSRDPPADDGDLPSSSS